MTILLGIVAAFWIFYGGYCLIRIQGIPRLGDFAPETGEPHTLVSILVAARNEASNLPRALPTLMAHEGANFEVVAVDDRSDDATGAILDDFAARDPRLHVVHIHDLPAGWLGKPHALQTAYEKSSGEWLLFTDADVRFHPEAVARALRMVRERNLDHLTLVAALDMHGFWEHTALSYIALAFLLGIRPWLVDKPAAGSYMGIGAFQMVRRSAYEAAGEHKRLAMEVVDDMKLGKMVKRAGFRSNVGFAEGYVRLRWQEGLRNITRGLTKNMFAGMSFHVWKAVGTFFAVLILSVLPFVALAFTHGLTFWLAVAASIGAIVFNAAVLRGSGAESPVYGIAHPVGALVFAWIAIRSMVVTLWRGGIVWRDTFYPLDELRRGSV
ncbi:MAG: glycosyltransferase [Acidobacteriota bacterium]|nr:glycosyltransferase [Acidobacteriota bacterium]